jgi:hypothetical protein
VVRKLPSLACFAVHHHCLCAISNRECHVFGWQQDMVAEKFRITRVRLSPRDCLLVVAKAEDVLFGLLSLSTSTFGLIEFRGP